MAKARQSLAFTAKARQSAAERTINPEFIRRWVEDRGGRPVSVKGTGGDGDVGVLRIDFPGYSGARSREAIEWDEFFQKFEENQLQFLYQERTADGERSHFNELVRRDDGAGTGARRS